MSMVIKSIRLPRGIADQLIGLAEQRGTSEADVVRELIKNAGEEKALADWLNSLEQRLTTQINDVPRRIAAVLAEPTA